MAGREKETQEEIRNRIKAMRMNGNPDWFIRRVLIGKGYPEELVDEFGLEKNKALSSITGGPR